MNDAAKKDTKIAIKSAVGTLLNFSSHKPPETFSFLKEMITSIFSRKARMEFEERQAQTKQAVIQAVETLKQHHYTLANMHHGDLEERKLAESAHQAIKQFHAILDKHKQPSTEWMQDLGRKEIVEALKHHRIELPSLTLPKSDKVVSAFQNCFTHSMTPFEKDIMRMKSLTLIQQRDFYFNFEDTLTLLDKAIYRSNADTNVMRHSLAIPLFGGGVIEVVGSFNKHASKPNSPVADSFQISYLPFSNAFPHPCHYAGWSLSEVLIPAFPQHLERLPLFLSLHEKRQLAIPRLQPYQNNSHAAQLKKYESAKKAAYQKCNQQLIELHLSLIEAMVQGSSQPNRNFAFLRHTSLEVIMFCWEMLIQHLFAKPYAQLHEHALRRQFTKDQTPSTILNQAKTQELVQLSKQLKQNETALQFIVQMEDLLWPAVHDIILQHVSEPFSTQAVMLDTFAQKLQATAYRQLIFHLDELFLENYEVDVLVERMLQEMLELVNLFKAPSIHSIDHVSSHIVNELEAYFSKQF